MEYKIFNYTVVHGNSAITSRSIDNIAYITRYKSVNSIRRDHDLFFRVLEHNLDHFDVENENWQHLIIEKSGAEMFLQFFGWRRFAEVSWEGEGLCKATAELPKGLKQVTVELHKAERTPIHLGLASQEQLVYATDQSDIYSKVFDPEIYSGFYVVFVGQDEQDDLRVISRPLADRGPTRLCENTVDPMMVIPLKQVSAEMEGLLREDRDVTLDELCGRYGGYDAGTLPKIWYNVRARLRRQKVTGLSKLLCTMSSSTDNTVEAATCESSIVVQQ
ncbi:hypothetical protein FALBO_1374 [Fusarium albosuccineum]|uniref:Uncharacterized protein n=1 Tax=Fusarium albosuccineum TaxID=1237068 RepID=A0A8H4LP15_9HYPO|nr:hypothetical protein FALBO_1374 [Fusarium albosuccineum]